MPLRQLPEARSERPDGIGDNSNSACYRPSAIEAGAERVFTNVRLVVGRTVSSKLARIRKTGYLRGAAFRTLRPPQASRIKMSASALERNHSRPAAASDRLLHGQWW